MTDLTSTIAMRMAKAVKHEIDAYDAACQWGWKADKELVCIANAIADGWLRKLVEVLEEVPNSLTLVNFANQPDNIRVQGAIRACREALAALAGESGG